MISMKTKKTNRIANKITFGKKGSVFRWTEDFFGYMLFAVIILVFFLLMGPRGCSSKLAEQRIDPKVSTDSEINVNLLTYLRNPILVKLDEKDSGEWIQMSALLVKAYSDKRYFDYLQKDNNYLNIAPEQLTEKYDIVIDFPDGKKIGGTDGSTLLSKIAVPTVNFQPIVVSIYEPKGEVIGVSASHAGVSGTFEQKPKYSPNKENAKKEDENKK